VQATYLELVPDKSTNQASEIQSVNTSAFIATNPGRITSG